MKYLNILIILLAIITSSYASQSYVKVTQTNNREDFRSINDTIKQYNLTMKIQKIYNTDGTISHVIYVGPFDTYEKGTYYQQQFKNFFPNPQVVTFDKKNKEHGFYFGLGLGFASTGSSYDKSHDVLFTEPKKSGVAYMGELGYVLKNGIFIALGYSSSQNSDLFFQNLYASLGYRLYNAGDFVPYASILAGGGTLTWASGPVGGVGTEVVNKSTSPLLGSRIGLIYDGFKSVSLAASYQLIVFDHKANISIDGVTNTTYRHSLLHTFLLEFQHKFQF